MGVTPVHRDDAAAGVLLALDKGAPGECYVLAGTPVRVRELIAELGQVAGRKPPRFTLPTIAVRAVAPLGRVVGPALGFPPNLREVLSSSDGVTFWATGKKAMDELGWTSRPLSEGLRDLVATS
jgi:dihydroflavonol-4-reductase